MEEKKEASREKVIGSLGWSFAERILAQLVSTVVGIVLARVLSPDDYGIVSVVMIFITVCNVFVTSGFGTAIVQKKEVDKRDFDTAFILSFAMSIVLYGGLFFGAPAIAAFYNMPQLIPVIRVLGVRIVLTSLNNIQQAHIQREMRFKSYFYATIIGTVLSCGVGIAMAFSGYGVWALVAQYLTNTTVGSIVMLFVCKWRPGLGFSAEKAKEIYSFGWKVLCTELVYTTDANVRGLLVGKVFGPADLAYYEQGNKYPSLLVSNVNATIQKVMLPTFSRRQDDLNSLKSALRRSIQIGAFLLCPLLVGLAVVSDNFVNVLLTEKWLPAVPYVCIFCMSYMTRPLESACHQALLAIGRSGLVFWIMLAINGIGLLATVIAVFVLKSVLWIAIFSLLTTLVSLICFLVATNRLIGYCLKEQISDIFPTVLISAAMGVAAFLVGCIPGSPLVILVVQILVGAVSYVALACIVKPEPFVYIRNTLLRRK